MRRILFAVLVSSALLAGSPATALARHHHSRHHHRHHARIRREHWGAGDVGQASESSDNAGTVASFTGGVLTITLTDGSTVSGRVTDGTEIECNAPNDEIQREDGGGDSGSGDDQGDDNGDQEANDEACPMSALTPGTIVHEAELEITGAGAIWEKLELQNS